MLYPYFHAMKFSYRACIAPLLAIWLLTIGFVGNAVQAANPDAFIIDVAPSTFKTNETVDMTIKAVTSNGDAIKTYQGDVFIEIVGLVDTADYTVPSDWLYTFLPEDQGQKLFSKGLAIKKAWTYTIKVYDISDETIIGQKTVIVEAETAATTMEAIELISPVPWWIEKNNIANVLATAPGLSNAPYDISINNISVAQGMTNANGDISAYVSGIIQWDNLLQIKILNAENVVIGESKSISFDYEPIKDGVFNSIKIAPDGALRQGEKASFTMNCSESVTSAQIKLSDGKSVPMDKKSAWIFTKDIVMDKEWKIQVDVALIVLGQTKNYTGVATMLIQTGSAIGKVRLYSDSIDKSKLNVTWEVIGSAPQFKIEYSTDRNNLSDNQIVQTNEIQIQNLTIGDTYYFRITPLDGNGNPIGNPSEISEVKIGDGLSCIVDGITVTGQKIGDKYYLVRSAVNNIEKYIIYRSEFETQDISQIQKIGETTGTMFEYPFNANSKTKKYEYYQVEGLCMDGTSLKIDSMKKIQTGPAENILLIIVMSFFFYTIYRLYGLSKN